MYKQLKLFLVLYMRKLSFSIHLQYVKFLDYLFSIFLLSFGLSTFTDINFLDNQIIFSIKVTNITILLKFWRKYQYKLANSKNI